MKSLKPILYAGALVGVLDITAACINARVRVRLRARARAAERRRRFAGTKYLRSRSPAAALGLVMHFTMALTVAAIFYMLTRCFPLPENFPGVVAWTVLRSGGVSSHNFATAHSSRGSQPISAHADLVQATDGMVTSGHSLILRWLADCTRRESIREAHVVVRCEKIALGVRGTFHASFITGAFFASCLFQSGLIEAR